MSSVTDQRGFRMIATDTGFQLVRLFTRMMMYENKEKIDIMQRCRKQKK
tara:strand:- start:229 stop:375 length:147 start_codon:yes stop_codon:yes gene_type:complete